MAELYQVAPVNQNRSETRAVFASVYLTLANVRRGGKGKKGMEGGGGGGGRVYRAYIRWIKIVGVRFFIYLLPQLQNIDI